MKRLCTGRAGAVSRRLALVGFCVLGLPLQAQAATESFLESPGPGGPLKGTLLVPASKTYPVVLIIPGSGPTDRDGNNPLGVKGSTYRLLAEGLAARGVASLRIDKRGQFASAAATPDPNAVTIADYAADVRSWVAVLRQQTAAPCVWLLGHSEGGLVAMAAASAPADLCGLVLVATAGRPLGVVLREQLQANPANGPLLGQALPAIDALEQGRRVDTAGLHPALQALFSPTVQGYLIDAFSHDPRRMLSAYAKPVLLLQGQRDLQVSESDAQALKQANAGAKLVLLPNVNHVLKAVTVDDRRANFATYADPALPLAAGVVEAIADFLDSVSVGAKP
jgi:alpha-beta hydrolase superfamily lysophospholipase